MPFIKFPYLHSSKFTLLRPLKNLVPAFGGWSEERDIMLKYSCWTYSSTGIIFALSYSHRLFQLAISKRAEENPLPLYQLHGSETLGSYLRIQPCFDQAPEVLKCSIQWYRVSSGSSKNEPISGIYSAINSITVLNWDKF